MDRRVMTTHMDVLACFGVACVQLELGLYVCCFLGWTYMPVDLFPLPDERMNGRRRWE